MMIVRGFNAMEYSFPSLIGAPQGELERGALARLPRGCSASKRLTQDDQTRGGMDVVCLTYTLSEPSVKPEQKRAND
jgi:hypothetical protein